MFSLIDCVDAGGEYCPCHLGESGECIICSQLKGYCFCDCLNWSGTCIYHEFISNKQKAKKEREYQECSILKKEFVRDDILLMDIKVSQTMARELDNIGGFVFLKKPGSNDMFNTPISILESDVLSGVISVAIKIKGVKSKGICECQDSIMVKGPYLNGIQGLRFIKDIQGKNVLVLIRGIAGAAAVTAVRKLERRGNKVDILIEKGRFGRSFLEDYFKSGWSKMSYISFLDKALLSKEAKFKINNLFDENKYDVVLSAGSDDFHRLVLNYIYKRNKKVNFATVNNARMCCGEGVCGSCSIEIKNKRVIRACKEQYNPGEVFI